LSDWIVSNSVELLQGTLLLLVETRVDPAKVVTLDKLVRLSDQSLGEA